jgi:hypothetical protein
MNKEEAIKKVSKDGTEIQNLPEEFKKDKDVVSAAVNQYGYALNFVDDIFKDTKSIVLLSLRESGIFIGYASEKLKNDKEVVLKAISNSIPDISWGNPDNFYEVLREIPQKMLDIEEILLALLRKQNRIDNFELIEKSEKLLNNKVFIEKLIELGLVTSKSNLKYKKIIGKYTIVADNSPKSDGQHCPDGSVLSVDENGSAYEQDYFEIFMLYNLHVIDENGKICTPIIKEVEVENYGYVLTFSTRFWVQGFAILNDNIFFITAGKDTGYYGKELDFNKLNTDSCIGKTIEFKTLTTDFLETITPETDVLTNINDWWSKKEKIVDFMLL